jgi:hypothetical protein
LDFRAHPDRNLHVGSSGYANGARATYSDRHVGGHRHAGADRYWHHPANGNVDPDRHRYSSTDHDRIANSSGNTLPDSHVGAHADSDRGSHTDSDLDGYRHTYRHPLPGGDI